MRNLNMIAAVAVLALSACKAPEGAAPEAQAEQTPATLGEIVARDYPQSFETWQGYVARREDEGAEWLKTLDVTSGPLVPVTLGEKAYMKGYACKTGATLCDSDRVVFFVAPDQSKIFGYAELNLPNGFTAQRMLGAANGEELHCLRFFIADKTGATVCPPK